MGTLFAVAAYDIATVAQTAKPQIKMLTEHKLLSGGNATHGFHYVCFNNQVIYLEHIGNRQITYAPGSWYGVPADCANWDNIRKHLTCNEGK
ncbi:MAG: hypothetical protein Unbinned4162contig1001_35 [Prokaryotic dsDNA virus sp.]|nr:MAG: hypothetical protein Unbinned4162contig1001_35 [Prokaryotic dsDNA virus sp.]|tara:strand:- start:6639 stop:6914 length:276 start_codon:yes stop_codon:yes gene_type:complete